MYRMNQYFSNISLLEFIEKTLKRVSEKTYYEERVQVSKYADRYMYEIELRNSKANLTCSFLIDKETFAIVESLSKKENKRFEESGSILNNNEVMYKYRPFQNKWILKESYKKWKSTYLDEENSKHVNDVKVYLEVKDFSKNPFPQFIKVNSNKLYYNYLFNIIYIIVYKFY